VGKGSEWIAADCDSEDNGPGTCETNDVGISTKEDRGVSTSKMGENKSAGEEGCIV